MATSRILAVAGLGLALLASPAAGVQDLTKENFDSLVFNSGKNAFVKFFAPWCGHCKALKPAWDKLGEAYKDSTSVLIGDVDCTASEAQELCSEHDVSGYPTVKYFTADTGKKGADYSGGRGFDDLDKFVKETLAKKCDPKTKEDCDDQEKAYIQKMEGKDGASLRKELGRLKNMKSGDMKSDKKAWLLKRLAILEGLAPAAAEGEL